MKNIIQGQFNDFIILSKSEPIRNDGQIVWENKDNRMAYCKEKVVSIEFFYQTGDNYTRVIIFPEDLKKILKMVDSTEEIESTEFIDDLPF